jgi:hypothetical protein
MRWAGHVVWMERTEAFIDFWWRNVRKKTNEETQAYMGG